METLAIVRNTVAVAALVAFATPAETRPTPVDVNGLVFDTTGYEKLKIRRLPRDEDFPDVTLRMLTPTTWNALSNRDGLTIGGTYETRGRRRNKLRMTLDNASLNRLVSDVLEPWGELLLDDIGQPGEGIIEMRNYRIRGKVDKTGSTVRLKGVFRFRATEVNTGRTVGGRYVIRLSGTAR